MMYTKTKLYCQGQVLGLLERNDNIYTFTYDDEWIERKSFAICPQMPVCHDVYTSEHLFSVFKDAMPDAWGKKIILIAENYASILAGRPQKPLFDFDYFLRCDNLTRQGAIKVDKQEKANIPHISNLSLTNIGKIENKNANLQEIYTAMLHGISSGGARPKANIVIDNEMWLCKLPSVEDLKDEPGWEYVNLRLAELCTGIQVPQFDLVKVPKGDIEKNLLIVKRFDKAEYSGIHYHEWSDLPYISLRTAINGQDLCGTFPSYHDLAELCKTDSDKREVFKRMVFNAVVGNRDDHERNHGFLWGGDSWRLSPVFDVQTTAEGMPEHSLYLGNDSPLALRENLLANVDDFALDEHGATEILDSTIEIVRDNWREIANEAGLSKNEIYMQQNVYEQHGLDKSVRQIARSYVP